MDWKSGQQRLLKSSFIETRLQVTNDEAATVEHSAYVARYRNSCRQLEKFCLHGHVSIQVDAEVSDRADGCNIISTDRYGRDVALWHWTRRTSLHAVFMAFS